MSRGRALTAGTIVFDGVCNFCSWSVRFLLRNDRTGQLYFVPLQTPTGQELLRSSGYHATNADTMLFIRDGHVFAKSDAVLEIVRYLGPWRFVRVLRIVPKRVRDACYSFVARRRYRWFGRRDFCFVPTPEQRSRFLDSVPVVQDKND